MDQPAYDHSRFADRIIMDPAHVMETSGYGPADQQPGAHHDWHPNDLKKAVDLGVRALPCLTPPVASAYCLPDSAHLISDAHPPLVRSHRPPSWLSHTMAVSSLAPTAAPPWVCANASVKSHKLV